MPGDKQGWGSGFTQPLALPESVRQRIRAALDTEEDEALPQEHAAPSQQQDAPPQAAEAPAERQASLPRRVPGANNGREPPAHIARPAMLPSLVHPRPAEPVPAVPAATLGAIAAAAGTPSDVAARPEVAAHPEVAVRPEVAIWPEVAARPGPAIAAPPPVPAQRAPMEQQPDRNDRRDDAGNGARTAAPPRKPMTRPAMWAYLGQAEAPTEPFPAIPAPRPGGVTEKAPAEQRPGRTDRQDEKTAGPEQARPSRDKVPSHQKNGQASLGKPQLHGAEGLARRPGEPAVGTGPTAGDGAVEVRAPGLGVAAVSVSMVGAAEPTAPAPPELEPQQPSPPKAPAAAPEPARTPPRPRRGRGFKVAVALALVVALAGSLALLVKRQGRTAQAIAPTIRPTASAAPRTPAEVRAATAAWVASQVSRAEPISCDPVMCGALWADGVPAADLLVLRPGRGDPLRSHVIVVTPAVTKMVGTEFLTADAPVAIASFGSGNRQVSVRVIYPQGAAAYAAALRQDIAERKASEVTLLENPRVTAPPAVRRQLQGGQVDPRLLLTLAQLASQSRLSIVAFGDRAPGASPGVPLRSADLAVAGDAAGRARQMSAFAHQLQGYFAGARIRAVRLANGQEVVRVEFAAPSPLGVLHR